MTFDLDLWKQQAAAKLSDFKSWVIRRRRREAPYLLYGYLGTMALWPLLEAMTAGQVGPVTGALGQIAGSVGGNLLANVIQNAKDAADLEAKVEAKLAGPDPDPAFREALDRLIAHSELITKAVARLETGEQRWFQQTLQTELTRLGSIIVLGNVTGDVVGGDKFGGDKVGGNKVTIINPDPAEKQRAAARRRYLSRLRRFCQALPLAALGGQAGDEKLTLDQLYVEMDTTSRVRLTEAEQAALKKADRKVPDSKPLPALDAARQTPQLALLGDPGAGKSSFVRKLLAWQAAALLGEAPHGPPGCAADLLPVLITLRDLAPALAGLDLSHLDEGRQEETLAQTVRQAAQADLARLEAAAFAPELAELLADGRCLLTLDGLDEVPQAERGLVRRAVEALLKHNRPARLILTCRSRSYVGQAVLPGLTAFTLAPFDEPKIKHFATAWYEAQKSLGQVDAAEAKAKAADLAQAALEYDRELAENPMLLTTMALIHQQDTRLPPQRVLLYDRAVTILLHRWQRRKSGEAEPVTSPELARFFKDENRLRLTMERLGYEAHRLGRGQKQAADLPRPQALLLLEKDEYLGSMALAQEFLDYVDQRTGLLVGQGGDPARPTSYSFPHRTFQEYLAGCYLLGRPDNEHALWACAGEGDYWHVAVRLGCEELYLRRRSENELFRLAHTLCATEPASSEQAQRVRLWAGVMAGLLEAANIERRYRQGPYNGAAYLTRQRAALLQIMTAPAETALLAPERNVAGTELAWLGDPRPAVTSLEGMQFCAIPPGPFMMGSDDYDDEKPPHERDIPHGYWLGRFPLTVAQFRAFVEASGHTPQDADSLRDPANRPVRYVTWHEAVKFCAWLSESWRGAGLLPPGWQVRLPSEAEWEKAARGGLEIPARPHVGAIGELDLTNLSDLALVANSLPQRRYPWGDDPDPNKANYNGTNIGTTSPVGCFPNGVSPYGVEELSGNVWEWTLSLWGKDFGKPDFGYPYDPTDGREDLTAGNEVLRVVRGGAFHDYQSYVRCANRVRDHPNFRFRDVGFRLVVSPF